MDYMASMIEKITIERNKKVDSAILGESQKIATENGIETKIVLNEKKVADALRKQIPQKPIYWCNKLYICPNCHIAEYIKQRDALDTYCGFCGQKIDWSEGE